MRRYLGFGGVVGSIVLSVTLSGSAAASAVRTTFTISSPEPVQIADGWANPKGSFRGSVYRAYGTASDPRMSGWQTAVVNLDWTGSPFDFTMTAQMWGTIRIDNEHGSWAGAWTGWRGAGWYGLHIINARVHGDGAYAGLHAELHLVEWAGGGEILDPGR